MKNRLLSLPLVCLLCGSLFVPTAAETDTADSFYSSFLSDMQVNHDHNETITDISELETGHIVDYLAYSFGGLAITCDDITKLQTGVIGDFNVEWTDGSMGFSSILPEDSCQLQPLEGYLESWQEFFNRISGPEAKTVTLSDAFNEADAPVYVITARYQDDYAQIIDALLSDSTVTLLGAVSSIRITPAYWGGGGKGIWVVFDSDSALQLLQEEYELKQFNDIKWTIPVSEDMTAEEAVELCAQLEEREGILEASPQVAVLVSTEGASGCSVALERFYTDLPGDLNADCVADISDAVLLARVVTEDDAVPVYGKSLNNADVDGDGLLTIMDVTALLDHIANIPAES